jgi:hypothetical protein
MRSVKATCRKGTLDLGPSLALAVLDLSETGVRLLLSQLLEPRQEVTITLEGPNHRRPLKFVAHVMWCLETADQKFVAGMQFEKRLGYMNLHKLT